jgi:hypothetical protein
MLTTLAPMLLFKQYTSAATKLKVLFNLLNNILCFTAEWIGFKVSGLYNLADIDLIICVLMWDSKTQPVALVHILVVVASARIHKEALIDHSVAQSLPGAASSRILYR